MTGRLKPYPRYKDSGVEWLGRIPAQWETTPLKRFARVRYGLGQPPPQFPDGSPLIRATNINSGKITDKEMLRVDPKDIPESRKATLAEGEIIVVRSGAYTGDSAIIPHHYAGAISGYDMVVSVKCGFSPYFAWQLLSPEVHLLQFGFYCLRAAQPHLNAEELQSTVFVVPPLDEQHAIASFLDRETGKIDALVKKKERLIELLQEKRTALISHAVTQGLNQNVQKKESGIPWLGHIPEHWEAMRLKFLLLRIDQGWSPVCANHPAENGQWGVLKAGCANGGVFNPTENKTLPDGIEPPPGIEVKSGDVLMSRASGSTELVGSVAFVREAPPTRLLLSDKTFRLVLRTEKIEPELVVWAMGSPVLRHQISGVRSGAEGLANNIAKGDIYNLVLPLPPRHEQQELCARIGDEKAKLDALMTKVRTAIARLQEYRTALISAAVTGQVDVRNCNAGFAA